MTPGDAKDGLVHEADSPSEQKEGKPDLEPVADIIANATEKLAGIKDAIEKAAHNLLELVENAMSIDEVALPHLEAVEKCGLKDLEENIEGLVASQDERMNVLTEMMTAMSFQDLACQTLVKVSSALSEAEARVLHTMDPQTFPPFEDEEKAPKQGSMSGLSRLEESQSGASNQDMIDQLLKGL